MAGDKIENFPCIPEKSWWILRHKFKESIPHELSKFLVSNILNISSQSAWESVIRQMRMIGLIDNRGQPTALAIRWQEDKKYKQVCNQIIKNVYPEELSRLFPSPMAPAAVVAKWFKDVCLCEGGHGKRCAEFYLLLLEGDPARGEEALRDPGQPSSQQRSKKKTTQRQLDLAIPEEDFWQNKKKGDHPGGEAQSPQAPTINVDFHFHIDAETPPEKVDEIFQRIAKHLKSLRKISPE